MSLPTNGPKSNSVPSMDEAVPHRPPADTEEVYYEGSPSLKGEVGTVLLCSVIALVVVVGAFAAAIHWGGKLWGIALLSLVAGAIAVAIPFLLARTTRYKITNYRIDFEHGLLSKSIETLELWHVEDIQFHQSLSNRMLGVGTLTIVSHDDTTPQLTMRGLPDPRRLFDLLKQRVISVKRSRGVLKVDA